MKRKGGGIEVGARIGKNNPISFKWIKPSIIDGRTCYQVGPFKWCKRKTERKTRKSKRKTRKTIN